MSPERSTYPPIPLNAGKVDGWKTIPVKQTGNDPLVPLGMFSEEAEVIYTSSLYFGEHSNSPYRGKNKLEGSLLTLFARQSVARRLVAAQKLLPIGCRLLVFDAYRPYEVQKSLYDFYKQQLSNQRPDMDNEALDTETQKYVSLPSQDATRPSPHNTGGAIDLTIIKRGEMLNFGTALDHGGEKSALAYFEQKLADSETPTGSEVEACNNRRLLYSVMTKAGFQPYFAEWWHFNAPESQMGAATAGHKEAIFGAAYFDENNRIHEAMRLKMYREAGNTQTGSNWPAEIIAPPEI